MVDVASNGEDGQHLGDTETYDAAVLDLGLPKVNGVAVLRAWRAAGRKLPVLILTARDGWSEKVEGFKAGADDYLVKPFRMEEVVMRLRALVRRAAGHATPLIICGPVAYDAQLGAFTPGRSSASPDGARMARALLSHAAQGPCRRAA